MADLPVELRMSYNLPRREYGRTAFRSILRQGPDGVDIQRV